MRRALLLAIVTAAGASLLAGCTPLVSPPVRAHDAPFAIPHDLTFDQLVTLDQACPPMSDSLSARHEP